MFRADVPARLLMPVLPTLSQCRNGKNRQDWKRSIGKILSSDAICYCGDQTMYDAVLVIMGLAMFVAFLAYAAACEKM